MTLPFLAKMEIKENCSSVFQFGRKSIEKIKILK
jgi:hypothetical protein